MNTLTLEQKPTAVETRPKELPRYVSISQIHSFLRCPRQFYYRYVRKMSSPPTGVMTLGKAVHSALEFNFGQKIKSHHDLPVDRVLSFLSKTFDELVPATRWKGPAESGQMKQSALALIKSYHETVAPTIQPFMVEEDFEIHLQGLPIPLRGIIDLVDTNGVLIDHKTGGQTPTADRIDREIKPQMMGYFLAYEAVTGSPPSGLRVDFLIRNKVPKMLSFPIEITAAQLKGFIRLLFGVTEMISEATEKQRFVPNPYNFTCTPDGCAYFDACRKEWRG
ncbi:MAG TPA: PD-(D/E)XK nuclease family protein [Elusimicrobiota bacterium]|nr:PD-(D/E)XK nuclease family protein [Elusimicrobiota bacterium]